MQDKQNSIEQTDFEGKKKGKKIFLIILTAAVSFLVLLFYRISLNFSFFPYVMWGYMIVLTALVIGYILYNRGFTRRGVTVDMLTDEWDDEKKREFVKSGEDRIRRSKWMLILIIAFMMTFLVDAIELFVIRRFF